MTVYTSRYGFQWNYQPHDSGWGNGYNFAMRYSAAAINCYLLSTTTPSPPSSPVEDDAYYVPTIASGDWMPNSGKMAVWQGGAWQYYTVVKGTRAYIEDRPGFFWFNGTLWLPEATSTGGVVLTVAGHPPDVAGNVALVVGDIAGAAALSSPNFTGVPLTPNAPALSRSLQMSNTKYVDDAVSAAGIAPGVISVAGRQGVVTLTHNDLTDWATATAAFGLPSIATSRVLANISGGTAVPSATTVTALLDAVFGTARGMVIYRGSTVWSALSPGTNGYVLTSGGAGADPSWLGVSAVTSVATSGAGISGGPITGTGTLTVQWNAGSVATIGTGLSLSGGTLTATGGGTVTSVGLTVPADMTVTGSPVTGAGTLAVTRTTQAANLVLAGPSSGAAAVPTYRALVTADMPSRPYDIAVYAEGALTASEVFLRWIAPRAISIASGASGSATSSGAVTGTAVINLAKNASNFGTVTYTSSATGVVSITSATAIAAGDTVTLTGPASVNATLLDVAITLAATQS
jgi:hypothetical protein